jgi:small neutral amino acid transporter SnatA (MarC family)
MSVGRRVAVSGLVLGLLLVVSFGIVAPPERCPSVSEADLQRASQSAVDWFVHNQRADGTWLYEYDADDDAAVAEYNTVRHAGAVMGLYQAAAADLTGALDAADRGTDWALRRLVERDDWAAVRTEEGVATGATALLAAGLAIRREDTGDTRYDDVLRKLGRFLLGQTEPSGAVLAFYDAGSDRPVPGEYSKYYTGEAYWALARLARALPGEGFAAAADRVGAYLAEQRDEAEGYWPPLADHWVGYGLADTAEERPLTAAELAYTRRQAELFGAQARWVQQRFGPWGGAVRGRAFRGGAYGVIGEGFTGLWRTAMADARLADLRGPLAARATCIAGLAVREQADSAAAAQAARPERVAGAWFFGGGVTRMDDQQHALAGLLRTIAIVSAVGASDSDDEAPSAWLWALALLLALNPARAVFGIPRDGRAPREVVRLAAVGGAIGALAVCVAAVLGDVLLDAVDVSAAAFRTAAGIVAVLTGAADLVRRPPSPEPALPGRRAALVPVAIPIVARPALLVVALAAGADRGVLVAVAAMVLGVALMTALVSRVPTEGPGGRALRWAGRVVAAGLVVAGVLVGIDGVMAV